LAQSGSLSISAVSHTEGYAGHSVTLTGTDLGTAAGSVTWGDEPCVVTSWTPTRVTAYLPDGARPGTRDLVVRAQGREAVPFAFTVTPPGITPTRVMADAFAFVRDKMRNSEGGVYTELVDRENPDLVYAYGHNVTSEHMGLMLWVSAAMLDHKTFEESFQYVSRKMISPEYNVVIWAIEKTTGEPFGYGNTPLDDFRVAKGLIAGWMQWQDDRYLAAALQISKGLMETSISESNDFPRYPAGLVTTGFGWDPVKGEAGGEPELVPVNYQDLWAMKWFAQHDPRWTTIIPTSIRMMEDAQIPSSSQFWNGLSRATQGWTGDWEYQDSIRGTKIKSIQSLWTAIHLARAGRRPAAQRALDFYKAQYERLGRIAEYYNPDGSEPTEAEFRDTLRLGEARIYSQVARLAYYLGDRAFADRVIQEKIVPDQDTVTTSPTYGSLGRGSADDGNAAAFDNLEALLGLALQQGSPVMSGVFTD